MHNFLLSDTYTEVSVSNRGKRIEQFRKLIPNTTLQKRRFIIKKFIYLSIVCL